MIRSIAASHYEFSLNVAERGLQLMIAAAVLVLALWIGNLAVTGHALSYADTFAPLRPVVVWFTFLTLPALTVSCFVDVFDKPGAWMGAVVPTQLLSLAFFPRAFEIANAALQHSELRPFFALAMLGVVIRIIIGVQRLAPRP